MTSNILATVYRVGEREREWGNLKVGMQQVYQRHCDYMMKNLNRKEKSFPILVHILVG